MNQTLEEVIKEESVNIAKSLEAIRDDARQNAQGSLYYETTSLYLNNFFTRYSLLLHDLIEVELDESSSAEVIYKFFVNIQGDSRYLFELFLMTCHFFNLKKEQRESSCISLRLSELIDVNKLDKVVDELNSTKQTKAKLSLNQNTYENLLRLAKKNGIDSLPEKLDECHLKTVGLKYYRNAKINYRVEWENNDVVKTALNFVRSDFDKIAEPMYGLYSLYEHPTYTSTEKLNDFIKLSKPERIRKIEVEKFYVLSMVKVVAKAMDHICRKHMLTA